MSRYALVLLALAPALQAADLGSAIAQCRSLTDAAARLACYDALPGAAVPAQPAPPAPLAPASAPAAPVATVSAEQSFGAEALKKPPAAREPAVEAIQSRLLGRIDDAERRQRYRLENGQVWENVDDRSRYIGLENPAVTIKRGLMGSYWLRFADRNVQIRVKRVQ